MSTMPRPIDSGFCHCGCGEQIPWRKHHTQRPPRFLPGHRSRLTDYTLRRKPPPSDWVIPSGLCECGCGRKTPIAKCGCATRDQYAGYPLRYIHGHNPRGKRAGNWKGGRSRDSHGYWWLYRPDHPKAKRNGYLQEHRVIWEETNGRLLHSYEDVHHIDGDRGNNHPSNLVALTKAQHIDHHAADAQTRQRKREGQLRRFQSAEERARHSERMRRWWEEQR